MDKYTSRYPIFFIMFLLPISLWVSADRATSAIAAGYLLLGIALYFALNSWSAVQKYPHRLARGLAFFCIALSAVAPFVTAWKSEFRLFRFPLYDLLQSVSIESQFGIVGTIHANVLAGTLVLLLPFSVVWTIDKSQRSETLESTGKQSIRPLIRWPWVLGSLWVIGVLILTQSRGAYIAAASSLYVVGCLMSGFSWRRVLLFTAVGGLICFVPLRYFVDSNTMLNIVATDSALGGSEFRVDLWSNSLYAITDFPFTGIGIGMFNQVVPNFYPFAAVNGAFAHHAHNLYLQVALDLGVFGLVAYLIIIMQQVWMLVGTLRSNCTSEVRLLSIAALGSIVALLVHGLLDAVTWATKLAFFQWVIFALVTIVYRYAEPYSNDSDSFLPDRASS